MDSETDFENTIVKLKTNYCSINKQPILFKNVFKNNMAKIVCDEIGIDALLKKTIFNIPNTKIIYLDYTIFKQYCSLENYSVIVEFVVQTVNKCIRSFGNFEIHINLDTFSISSCHRYKDVIKLFCGRCTQNNSSFCDKLLNMYIYNTPAMMNQISILLKPFIDSTIVNKIIFINKENSKEVIKNLLSMG